MQSHHKIVITGTGRAGTTFLVRLLTALGQPTGYSEESWKAAYFPHCEAGLEHDLTDPRSPYIVKNPDLCVTLGEILSRGGVVIDHAIVPMRELEAAALSRVRIGGVNGNVPGGLIGTDDPERQRAILAERFHRLVHTLVARDIPHTFLLFPRFVSDVDYAYAKLHPVFPDVDRASFATAFNRIADPALVHSFAVDQRPASSAAEDFRHAEQRKHQVRRVRRFAGWSAVAAGLVAAVAFRPAGEMTSHPVRPVDATVLPYGRTAADRDRLPHRPSAVIPPSQAGFGSSLSVDTASRASLPLLLQGLAEMEPVTINSNGVPSEPLAGAPVSSLPNSR